MSTKKIFECDCCHRDFSGHGWVQIQVTGDKKLIVEDSAYDLCEICWRPLKPLIEELAAKARYERSQSPRG